VHRFSLVRFPDSVDTATPYYLDNFTLKPVGNAQDRGEKPQYQLS